MNTTDNVRGKPAPSRVRRAEAADAQALVGLLSRAFENEPLVGWLTGERRRREYLFAALLEQALPHGFVYTTADRAAVAVWLPPGAWGLSLPRQLLLLPRMLRAIGFSRLPRRLRGIAALHAEHPRAPHYYLQLLGVEPARQGQGLGSAVLRPVLRVCDAEGFDAHLETASEANLALYRRHGFRVRHELRVPPDGPRTWFMWRPADDEPRRA